MTTPASDMQTLVTLNDEYVRSVQQSDVKRFELLLADDFLATLSDGSLLDRKQFLAYTAKPVTISNLAAHDVNVRLMGDFAIVHARTTFTLPDGRPSEGRYRCLGTAQRTLAGNRSPRHTEVTSVRYVRGRASGAAPRAH
jgi:ketosteroid isomerase-like protein